MHVGAQPGRLLFTPTASRPLQLGARYGARGSRGVHHGLRCSAVRPSSSGRLSGQRRRQLQPAQSPPEVQPMPHASLLLPLRRRGSGPHHLPVLRVSKTCTTSQSYIREMFVDLPLACVAAHKFRIPMCRRSGQPGGAVCRMTQTSLGKCQQHLPLVSRTPPAESPACQNGGKTERRRRRQR